jgi:hypothetical protein
MEDAEIDKVSKPPICRRAFYYQTLVPIPSSSRYLGTFGNLLLTAMGMGMGIMGIADSSCSSRATQGATGFAGPGWWCREGRWCWCWWWRARSSAEAVSFFFCIFPCFLFSFFLPFVLLLGRVRLGHHGGCARCVASSLPNLAFPTLPKVSYRWRDIDANLLWMVGNKKVCSVTLTTFPWL